MLYLHKIPLGDCPPYIGDTVCLDSLPNVWVEQVPQLDWLPPRPDEQSMRRLLSAEHMPGRPRRTAGGVGGVQLTFSAPKSVSVAALVAGDTRVITAHLYALQVCLTHIRESVACRITRGGITAQEPSSTLLGAAFHRHHSRSHDPHLHTHVVVVNSGATVRGEWRALDIRYFWDETRLLGNLYQSTLALALQSYGYTIAYGATGLIEIANIEQDVCARLSSRQDQIRNRVKAVTGLDLDEISALGKRPFAVNSAPARAPRSYSSLVSAWQERAGPEMQQFKVPASRGGVVRWGASREAADALEAAYGELRSQAGGVKFSRLLSHVYEGSGGQFSMHDLLETMADSSLTCYSVEGVPATVFDGGEDLAGYWCRRQAKDEHVAASRQRKGGSRVHA